jgi:3-oxoacyl-[acyl-carrier-protein] synthase III
MSDLFLSAFGSALGEPRELADLADEIGQPEVDRLTSAGLGQYRLSQQPPWRLAAAAVRDTLQAGPPGVEIDLVVYVTDTYWRDDFYARDPARFLAEVGLRRAQLVGIGLNGCANASQALRTAAAYLRAGAARRALVVCTDVGRSGARLLSSGGSVLSDGAASCLVSIEPPTRGYRLLGATVAAEPALADADPMHDVLMILKATADGIRRAAADLREQTKLDGNDYHHLVMNNYSRAVLATFAGLVEVPFARTVTDMLASVAHCFSADPFINLAHLLDSGRAAPAQPVLVLDSGQTVWGVTALEVVG